MGCGDLLGSLFLPELPLMNHGHQEKMLIVDEEARSQETWEWERVPYSTDICLPSLPCIPMGYV